MGINCRNSHSFVQRWFFFAPSQSSRLKSSFQPRYFQAVPICRLQQGWQNRGWLLISFPFRRQTCKKSFPNPSFSPCFSPRLLQGHPLSTPRVTKVSAAGRSRNFPSFKDFFCHPLPTSTTGKFWVSPLLKSDGRTSPRSFFTDFSWFFPLQTVPGMRKRRAKRPKFPILMESLCQLREGRMGLGLCSSTVKTGFSCDFWVVFCIFGSFSCSFWGRCLHFLQSFSCIFGLCSCIFWG